MVIQIAIPALAVTFVAAAFFVYVLFAITDWWEIITIAALITMSIYFMYRS